MHLGQKKSKRQALKAFHFASLKFEKEKTAICSSYKLNPGEQAEY